MAIKSRIHQFLPEDCMKELNKVKRDVLISDNNKKIDLFCAILDKYEVPYTELGGGTNRFAIMIDNYAFKIAMDKDGEKDNWMEFSLTQELQPFVVKCYECNGLILVTEYVNLVTRDEFMSNKEEMRLILSYIAQGYLLGDVGTIPKNFTNWGYRDSGEWVILDFAYLYRIRGEEMKCGHVNKSGDVCEAFLEYDYDYSSLRCPKCGHKYIFNEIRGRISKEFEDEEVDFVKNMAYVVTQPITEFGKEGKRPDTEEDECEDDINNERKDDDTMGRNHNYEVTEEEAMESYLAALASLKTKAREEELEAEEEPKLETNFESLEETIEEMVDAMEDEPIRLIDEDGDIIDGEDEEPEYITSPYVDEDPHGLMEDDEDEEWAEEPVEVEDEEDWYEDEMDDEEYPETSEDLAQDESYMAAVEDISENKDKYVNEERVVEEASDDAVTLTISTPEIEPLYIDKVATSNMYGEMRSFTAEEVEAHERVLEKMSVDTGLNVVDYLELPEEKPTEAKIDIGMGISIDVKYTEPAPQEDEEKSFLKIEKPVVDLEDEEEYDEWYDEAVMENLEAKYASKKKFN